MSERFTNAELDAIIRMANIASASPMNEGDYAGWTLKIYHAALDAASLAAEILAQRKLKGGE